MEMVLVWSLVVAVLGVKLWQAFTLLVWRPYVMTKLFRKQGIRGPPYKILRGSVPDIRRMVMEARETTMDVNSHDIIPRILPHYHLWASRYGKTFLYWSGTTPEVCIADPELVRQVLSNKFGFYGKGYMNPGVVSVMGRGLAVIEGAEWARHRRVLNPAFTTDKLKMMSASMAECTLLMLERWDDEIPKEVDVSTQMKELTANVIAHTAFGSSYSHGKEAFATQRELHAMAVASLHRVSLPGMQYLPTKKNLRKAKLEKKLKSLLAGIINRRVDSSRDSGEGYGNDLLGLMLEAFCSDGGRPNLSLEEIIEECKTFFFAGYETTSHFLIWTIFLLSTNPEWQDKLRQETARELGTQAPPPNAEILGNLKLLHMVLLETLRLYPPIGLTTRTAEKEMRLGELNIPKGAAVAMPIVMMQRDEEYWGDDANEFRPCRFENGMSKAAKHPNAFMPFSVGPRICIGQSFAMLEAKMVLTLLLQRFSFCLSPNYKHAPIRENVQPQFGVPILFKPLHVQ